MDVNEMATIPGILRSSIYNQCVFRVMKLAKNLKIARPGLPPKPLKMDPKSLKMGKLGGC